jgi:hypothetical protein
MAFAENIDFIQVSSSLIRAFTALRFHASEYAFEVA